MEMGPPIAASAVLLLPLVLCILRWAHQRRFTGGLISGPGSLPPGSMGWPLIGEMLDFLRYFKFAKRPDDFISKRKASHSLVGCVIAF
ncbi:Ent-kaurenoic acid oxidase 1 [Platanthera guangdongensis]|uniref:Ent-kaurenoic acid oxidase 1 n=1 Tax=Platanthera guangdongensis TaxID=2320717 RepID=A0ABR2LCN2_9ASPA